MNRLATLIVITASLIFGVHLVLRGTLGAGDVMFFVSSALGLYWVRSGFLNRDLKFDEEFFHYDNDIKIPLSSITAIKLGLSSNLQHDRYWRIQYKVSGSDEKSITLLPSVTNDNFMKFLRAVEARNPSVETDMFKFELLWGFMPKITWRVRGKGDSNQ
ncbi:hypothetical protein [Dyadobacter jiangsuensis]|uniref:Uncharacterized protein n=1 Tax=Dyadobacter jiangsuensis TaxID=1591085 RepID=A0A2P8G5D1_9BACT|nr:hypothetical protein [Dyadobacter jiangsuensis]PSL29167.1 hypothetical protein CLV60_1051 [Dyadobacter jiangsuensis]